MHCVYKNAFAHSFAHIGTDTSEWTFLFQKNHNLGLLYKKLRSEQKLWAGPTAKVVKTFVLIQMFV